METISVALICTLVTAAISYLAFSRNKTRDDKSEGQQSGIMMSELGYIKGSIDNVSKKMDKQDERHIQLVERISSVEASAKQAHKRLDRMEGREYPGHHEEN